MRIFLLSVVGLVACCFLLGPVVASEQDENLPFQELEENDDSYMQITEYVDDNQDESLLLSMPHEILEYVLLFMNMNGDYANLLQTCSFLNNRFQIGSLPFRTMYCLLGKRYDLESLNAMLRIPFTQVHRQLKPEYREKAVAKVHEQMQDIELFDLWDAEVDIRFEQVALLAMTMQEMLCTLFTLFIPANLPIRSPHDQEESNFASVYQQLFPALQEKMCALVALLSLQGDFEEFMQLYNYLHEEREQRGPVVEEVEEDEGEEENGDDEEEDYDGEYEEHDGEHEEYEGEYEEEEN